MKNKCFFIIVCTFLSVFLHLSVVMDAQNSGDKELKAVKAALSLTEEYNKKWEASLRTLPSFNGMESDFKNIASLSGAEQALKLPNFYKKYEKAFADAEKAAKVSAKSTLEKAQKIVKPYGYTVDWNMITWKLFKKLPLLENAFPRPCVITCSPVELSEINVAFPVPVAVAAGTIHESSTDVTGNSIKSNCRMQFHKGETFGNIGATIKVPNDIDCGHIKVAFSERVAVYRVTFAHAGFFTSLVSAGQVLTKTGSNTNLLNRNPHIFAVSGNFFSPMYEDFYEIITDLSFVVNVNPGEEFHIRFDTAASLDCFGDYEIENEASFSKVDVQLCTGKKR